jgi:hypothetical protein
VDTGSSEYVLKSYHARKHRDVDMNHFCATDLTVVTYEKGEAGERGEKN